MDVACKVSSDTSGSDYHPIIITVNISDYSVLKKGPKWNFKNAKWDAFQNQCITDIIVDIFDGSDDKMAISSNILLNIGYDIYNR